MADNIVGGSVVWNFDVNDTGLKTGLATARGAVAATAAEVESTMGQSLSRVGTSLYTTGRELTKAVTIPIVALGTAIFKTSADFEESLNKLVGLVGISRKQVQAWTGDFERLGEQTGKSPNELAQAMFFITSAGLRGQAALDALTASAKASAAGLGDTATVANAVTSAVNSYAKSGLTASQATDILAASVKAGKVDAASLAPVLGNILPISAALGVSFKDVGGAMASMTRVGLDAASASTSIRGILSALIKPGTQAKDAIASVGLNFQTLRDQLKQPGGIITVMRELNDRFGDNEEGLAKVIPDARAFRGVMSILAQGGSAVNDVMSQVANSTGLTDKAFQAASEGPGFKFHQVMSQISTALIQIGDTAAPVMAGAMKSLGNTISSLANIWDKIPKSVQKSIITFLGLLAALGPVLLTVGALIRLSGKFDEALTAIQKHPVIYAIAALVTLLIYLQARFQLFTKLWAEMNKIWDDTVSIYQRDIYPALDDIRKWFDDAKRFIGDLVSGALHDLGQWFKDAKQWIKDVSNAYSDNKGNLKIIVDTITVLVLPALIKLAATALWSAAQVAAAGAIAAAGWIASKASELWGWATSLPGLVLTAAKNAAKVAAQGVIAAAGWIADGAATLWGWVGSLASLVLESAKQAITIAAQGVIAAAGWVATGWGWLAHLAEIAIAAALTAAEVAADGIIAAAPWIAAAAAAALAWLIAAGPIIIIVGSIVLAIAVAAALIIKYWSDIKQWAVDAWQAVYKAVKDVADWIVGFFSGAIGWLSKAGRDIVNGLANGISGTAHAVWTAIKGAADQIGGFFAGAWNWLYNSGRAIIQGLANGISSIASAPVNAVKSILSKVRNLLPFSPAKEGPFSGKGWTLYSGKSLVQGFVDGINQSTAKIQEAGLNLVGTIAYHTSGIPNVSDMHIGQNNKPVVNNIGEIHIASEVDGHNWLQKLTRDDTITSAGLTSNVSA